MLVLTRREKEIIDIVTKSGEVIEVYVVKHCNKYAQIGIKAEREVVVQRREVNDPVNLEALAESRRSKL